MIKLSMDFHFPKMKNQAMNRLLHAGFAILNIETSIGQGRPKGPLPPKCLENVVILCFERRF